ncbi:MAG: hypothetical protein QOG62_491 [Thermoleophilaceae bacterium]|nr:hypothetical protein [Thermoleophilaceae bacterium]
MGREQVDVTQEWAAPVEKVFDYLGEHENLSKVFGIKVERLRSGDTDRNGVGSVRKLGIGPITFEETVTDYKANELIEYTITKGTPLKDHLGTMRFSSTPSGGSRLHYTIAIEGPPIITTLVRMQLQRSLSSALPKIPV